MCVEQSAGFVDALKGRPVEGNDNSTSFQEPVHFRKIAGFTSQEFRRLTAA